MNIVESIQSILKGVLEANNGNMRQAALSLGVEPVVFWGWMQGRGLTKPRSLFEALDRAGAVLSISTQESDAGDADDEWPMHKPADQDDDKGRMVVNRLRAETYRMRAELSRAEGQIEGLMMTFEMLSRSLATKGDTALNAPGESGLSGNAPGETGLSGAGAPREADSVQAVNEGRPHCCVNA